MEESDAWGRGALLTEAAVRMPAAERTRVMGLTFSQTHAVEGGTCTVELVRWRAETDRAVPEAARAGSPCRLWGSIGSGATEMTAAPESWTVDEAPCDRAPPVATTEGGRGRPSAGPAGSEGTSASGACCEIARHRRVHNS